MSFNKITIVGNLGRDPELRYTPQGVAVCSFSMATTEKRNGQDDVTTWFKVTLWRERAENAAKYLTKGSPVYIEGRLKIEEWTDRDNNNRYTLDVQGTEMQFIGGGNRQESTPGESTDEAEEETPSAPKAAKAAKPAKANAAKAGGKVKPDDDIPF